jgi:hypothetical protein
MRADAAEFRGTPRRAVLLFCVAAAAACRTEETGPARSNEGAPAYRCEGFAGPIEAQMQIPRGRTLPLKASLLDASGKPAGAQQIAPPPVIRLLKQEGGAEEDATEEAEAGDFGDAGQFVFRESYWKFDLATADFPELGTFRAEIAPGDESRYRIDPRCAVTFVLKE